MPVAPLPRRIDHQSVMLWMGSCFAEHIGNFMREYHFGITRGPFGILYNPLSIARGMGRMLNAHRFSVEELFEHEGIWRSFDHHGSFSDPSREMALRQINTELAHAVETLQGLDVLLLTFGTAWGYFLRDTGDIVANCHRLPRDRFERRLIASTDIEAAWRPLLDKLFARRPELIVIATVSPIRHLRDDPHENAVSKAHLLCALDALMHAYRDRIYYFPGYEIMMDDLRDYRFYDTDMCHPSQTAREYIRKRFAQACLSEKSREVVAALKPIHRAMKHRPEKQTNRLRKFAQSMLGKIQAVENRFPFLELDKEYAWVGQLEAVG